MNNNEQFNRFTKEAKAALIVAQERAKTSQFKYVGTEHILIGILSQEKSLGASILLNFGVSLDNVNLVLESVGRNGVPDKSNKPMGLSAFAQEIIELSAKAAHDYQHSFIGTEHLLYAIVSQNNTAATVILENMKVAADDVKQQILEIFERAKNITQSPQSGGAATAQAPKNQNNPNNMNPIEFFLNGLQGVLGAAGGQKQAYQKTNKKDGSSNSEEEVSSTPALDYFSSDLVEEAKKGKIDPIIGRDLEIDRTISILSRKTKNNPVIIGESGVGKTAVIEGLAHAIAKGKVPDNMLDKKILSISMASVVAGTKYRGEFEERIKQIIEEASDHEDIILFIDELHTVVGAGSAEGSLDAANILKPALSRSKIQIIGATTIDEYRKNIEKDAALDRRFQSVVVKEPSNSDTLEILKGIREGFEDHHDIVISDDALIAAVEMSKRYINNRYLPDKAIDLIDEAAAKIRIKSNVNKEKIIKLQKKLKSTIKKKELAVANQDYEKAADFRDKELLLVKDIDGQKSLKTPRNKRKILTENNIAKVISSVTGVPVTKLMKNDMSRLKLLEKVLKKRIIGQDEAVSAVSNAIRRSRAGFADEKRPIGSFIFMGPTGVGKTELVKAVAEEVYNDPDALIKIDMSEFMERHNTSRLVGATAGYVGYEEGGQLTEKIKRNPYSVILFDEIEKAHPDVFNLLLQILEDGELTDAQGSKVDFKNTIIIMTSNIGAKRLTDKAAPIGFSSSQNELEQAEQDFENVKEDILSDLKDHFKPEFLNRIDKIVVFQALTSKNIKDIVKLHLATFEDRLKKKNLKLETTSGALDLLSKSSYDPKYGARPIRRALQTLIEDPLTSKFLDGEFSEGDTIKVLKKGKKLELVKM